eukprot:877393-Prymnesium_polylepis.1
MKVHSSGTIEASQVDTAEAPQRGAARHCRRDSNTARAADTSSTTQIERCQSRIPGEHLDHSILALRKPLNSKEFQSEQRGIVSQRFEEFGIGRRNRQRRTFAHGNHRQPCERAAFDQIGRTQKERRAIVTVFDDELVQSEILMQLLRHDQRHSFVTKFPAFHVQRVRLFVEQVLSVGRQHRPANLKQSLDGPIPNRDRIELRAERQERRKEHCVRD